MTGLLSPKELDEILKEWRIPQSQFYNDLILMGAEAYRAKVKQQYEQKGLVELPDMMRVGDWFKTSKLELKCQVRMQNIPDTCDVRVTVEHNFDDMLWILMMNFCIALRKGDV